MSEFRDDPILPDPPAGARPVLHDREYRIRSFRLGPDVLLVQGALRDQKPAGLFVPEDPEPLTIHHMTVSMQIEIPTLEIVGVTTEFRMHPHDVCPAIVEHYDELVGLSVRRGFTHRIRELFGGPRGCSHTTALLQAMAPIAMQSLKGVEVLDAVAEGRPHPVVDRQPGDESWRRLVGTCHVWAEGGERIEQAKQGGTAANTRVVLRRMDELQRAKRS